jgi:hypothetical protein
LIYQLRFKDIVSNHERRQGKLSPAIPGPESFAKDLAPPRPGSALQTKTLSPILAKTQAKITHRAVVSRPGRIPWRAGGLGACARPARGGANTDTVQDLKFPLSIDGEEYHAIASRKNIYIHGGGGYGYWTPAVYGAEGVGRGETCFKIERTGAAQNGRVEIRHSPARHRG